MSTPSSSVPAVVIGAGIVGCSIAYALASRGHDVQVLDKGPGPGTGSTSASSAVVRFSYSTLDAVKLSWESLHLWTRWTEFLGASEADGLARFIRTGLLVLDSPLTTIDTVRNHFDALAIPYEQVTADQIRDRWPQLDTGRYYPPRTLDDDEFWQDAGGTLGGYLTPDAGYVDDPALAAQNLMMAAQRHGARFRFRAPVTGLAAQGGRIIGARVQEDLVPARVVINAAGPWSAAINRLAGPAAVHRIGTRPLRQEVHSLTMPADYATAEGAVAVSDSDLGTYFRPHLGTTLLVGGVEPECDPLVWVDDPDQAEDRPTTQCWEAQTTRLARRVPSLTVPGRPAGLSALYDVSDDWMPVYDRTDIPGYYTAIGTSGHQFKNAPMIGTLMAELIEACENGHDHDRDPVTVTGPTTGTVIDVGHFSRLRSEHHTTRSVIG